MISKMIQRPAATAFVMLAVATAVIILTVIMGVKYDTLNFTPVTYEAVVDVLTPALFVALLIERLLEVFVSNARKEQRIPLEKTLQQAKETIQQLTKRSDAFQAQLDAPSASDLSEQQRDKILERKESILTKDMPAAEVNVREAVTHLEKYKAETRKVAYVSGTAIGLIIALAGVRVLSPIVDFDLALWSNFQKTIFQIIDVALTGALLAGGAAGIHQIISVFGDYTKRTRQNIQG